jgi:hypothetical protein
MIHATKTIVRFVNAFLSSDEAAMKAIWLEASERPKLAEKLRQVQSDLMDQIEAGANIWR